MHGIVDEKTSQRMDELTACRPNHIRPYGTGKDSKITLEPNHWGMRTVYPTTDLVGGSLPQNLSILRGIAQWGCARWISVSNYYSLMPPPHFGSPANVGSIEAGIDARLQEVLCDGSVSRWLNKAREHFVPK